MLLKLSALLALTFTLSFAQASVSPQVLIVVAHPDDEYFFAGAVYRITHDLKGTVDQVILTDGREGYRFSLLAQPIYHEKLTDREVAARKLPAIRKNELKESGALLGIHEHFFLDHPDHRVEGVEATFKAWGGKERVKDEVKKILDRGKYDFVFTLLPTGQNHEHHNAAGILATEIVQAMPADRRPVILAGTVRAEGKSPQALGEEDPPGARTATVYQKYESTRIQPEKLTFDRGMKFGPKQTLSYQTPVNWMIAAHKSQGAFQTYFNRHRYEDFRIFSLNSPTAIEKARDLFKQINAPVNEKNFSE
jgi:LmbE family N-acetylglucosaminyl deacetylase